MLNNVRPWRNIYRRKSRKIFVGGVGVGGDAPISVQSMTNTITSDVSSTLDQIRACAEAGADLVRVSCPDIASTEAMKDICKERVQFPLSLIFTFTIKEPLKPQKQGQRV